MIQQIDNKSVRKCAELHSSDISYLQEYYNEHGMFPMFKQVLIETRTDCNNNCSFCPHHFNKKKLGIMKWDCYTTIIDQLCELNYNGRVALMLSNEPLLDDRLEDMILYAKSKSQRLFLDMTTNGKLLSLGKLDRLFSLGLDNVNINDYRDDRDKNPRLLTPNIASIMEAYGNNPKVDIHFRRTDERWPNYAGNIPQDFVKEDYGFCNFPFRKLTIAYTGDILLCCDDFLYDTKFGNAMKDNLLDCWNNKELEKIKLSLLKNKRINICSRCNDFQDYKAY